MNPTVKAVVEACAGWIYPNACQLCGHRRAPAAEGYVCSACWKGLRFIQPPYCRRCGLPFAGAITDEFECANCREIDLAFEFARAAVVAEGVALEVIHRYKYQRALWFEPVLGDLLRRAAGADFAPGEWHGLVPVPLHPVREREREFNQANRLAEVLGRTLGLPVWPQLVRRTAATRTQTRLSRDERSDNVRRAFAPVARVRLTGQRLLVVDDVLTTGATTHAVACVLRELGAETVGVLTAARATLESAGRPVGRGE
jgi:ComF family protein